MTTTLQGAAQASELRFLASNVIVAGITGAIGGLINKKDHKAGNAVLRGLAGGACGGLVMYAGKKSTRLISTQHEPGYAWLSRIVYSAGNSMAENAAASVPLLSHWHYDIGFIRFEYAFRGKFTARLMPSSLGGFLFRSVNGRPDLKFSLRVGTFVYRTSRIAYAPWLIGSTTGNGILMTDTLRAKVDFPELFAHEMVHVFQFADFTPVNNFFLPLSAKWKSKNPAFANVCRYVYADWNYELMLLNYFVVQGGHTSSYCRNFLENEAEVLSTGRSACP